MTTKLTPTFLAVESSTHGDRGWIVGSTHCRRWTGVLGVCAVICASALLPASAAPTVVAPAKAALEISLKVDAKEFRLPIVNETRSRVRVRVRLLVTGRLKSRIDTTSGLTKLKSNAVTRVPFTVRKSLPAGSFSAVALIKSPNGRRTLGRSQIRLAVAEEPPAPAASPSPVPAVADLHAIAYRDNPWDDDLDIACEEDTVDNCHKYLPLLRAAVTEEELKGVPKDTPLGFLPGSRGGFLVVQWTGGTVVAPDEDGGTTALELTVAGTVEADTYSGTVDILPEVADSATFDLTVVVTDHWYWAALALALGVGLALLVRRWRGLGQKVSQLTTEADAAYASFPTAGPPGPGYAIDAEAERLHKELHQQIEDLDSAWGIELSEDDPAYKAAVANLAILKEGAAAWASFQEELSALGGALTASVATKAGRPVGVDDNGRLVPNGPEIPRWREDAQKLVSPDSRIELDFERLEAYRARVRKATALALSWGPLNEQLASLDNLINLIETRCSGLDGDQIKALTEAKMQVSEARWELWYAADADDLERRTSQLDLAAAERNVARLSDCLRRTQQPDLELAFFSFAVGGLERGVTLSVLSRVADMPVHHDPAVAAAWETAKRRVVNAAVLWVLVVALLYGGLEALYLGKTVFGTWRDYLQALAWGLGATVGVDYFSSALDSFREARSRTSS